MRKQIHNAVNQRGIGMIEIMVSILICAFGLLGYVGLQARSTAMELESYQRSQALVLLQDIVSRVNANRGNVGNYVSAELYGSGNPQSCANLNGSQLDLCEWSNLLRGSAESRGANRIGAMTGARGCIRRAAGTSDRLLISIAWQGLSNSAGANNDCGKGDASFPDETLRRAVSASVCVALLRDPAAGVVLAQPRC
jgi:type IV pilus assembly protein PilV